MKTTVHLIRSLQAMVTNATKAERQMTDKHDAFPLVYSARRNAEAALHLAQVERENQPLPRKVNRGPR